MAHGHSKAEERHRALHRLAFEKLRADPEGGRKKIRRVLEDWLSKPDMAPAAPLLRRWQEALDLPVDELEDLIINDPNHQLIQCSPMGVLVTPQERFAVYRELMAAGR